MPAAPAHASDFTYSATSNTLEYSYTTVDGSPGADVATFEIITSAGVLSGTVVVEGAGGTVDLLHEATGQTVSNTFVRQPGKADQWAGHLVAPGLVETFYEADMDTGEFSIRATAPGFFCNVLENTPFHNAISDATLKLIEELATVGSLNAPSHLIQITSVVALTKLAPSHILCTTTDDPMAGGCYYDSTDFITCQQCCEAGLIRDGVIGGCAALGWDLCTNTGIGIFFNGACGGVAGGICGGLVTVAEQDCVMSNCTGKEGDPLCPPAQACGADGSGAHCMAFCGPGHAAACGTCPEVPFAQQECCH
jgi:hypothetical protein